MSKQLKKWNYQKKEYEEYSVPDSWNVGVYAFDMDTCVDCAHCGTPKPYGLTFTSMEIHTEAGIGYAVCDKCYEEEMGRRYGK